MSCKRNVILPAALAASLSLLAIAGPGVAAEKAPETSHVLLPAADYIEIQQLYGMYARDVDPGSARDASWMFAPDAVLIIENMRFDTPEKIKTFYQGVRRDQGRDAGVRHFNSTFVIVGTPDGGARGSSYMMHVETPARGGRPQITLFGKYEDKLVKTPVGWRIKERVFTSDTFRGSGVAVNSSPVPGDRATDRTGAEAAGSQP